MEPHTHKEPYTGVTIEEVDGNTPREPFFTPPTPKADKPTVPSVPGHETVGDGEEFEVVKTEEFPAQPHEHGVSDPKDSKPASLGDDIPSSMGDSGGDTVVAE